MNQKTKDFFFWVTLATAAFLTVSEKVRADDNNIRDHYKTVIKQMPYTV